jgi:serine/threonine protein kinase
MGLLLDYIDHSHTLADYLNSRRLRENGSTEQMLRWIRQVKETVHDLHNAGIIWGDVKPDNILIDKKNNPWIVDFGGGYNSRWVDEDMMETVAGDLQGISRIEEHIGQL